MSLQNTPVATTGPPDNSYAAASVMIDVKAASMIDGWIDICVENGQYWGCPPNGQRRPVVRYSKDSSRALHLARRAAGRTNSEVDIFIDHDGITVEAYFVPENDDDSGNLLFHMETVRTEQLAELLVRCAIELVSFNDQVG